MLKRLEIQIRNLSMLLDEAGISPTLYWGFFQLTDNQFDYILKKGNVNENFIID